MDMQQLPQEQPQGEDPAALLKQAQDLIGKALAAMGGEEQTEEGQMQAQRAGIAKEVFGQGGY